MVSAYSPAKRRTGIRAIPLPVWILIGAVSGIVCGVVLGERAAILRPVGLAYAMMVQMAVYPYLLCALLYSLGRLTPATARRLLGASWAVYLFIWLVTLTTIWLLARAIPVPPPPSVLTPDMLRIKGSVLNLVIPANLFDALERNYVPAVVVFAIVYGIAIQKIPNKSAFFEILEAIRIASVTIWGWIVAVAPIGVFALFATAAGTIEPDRLGGLLLYVGLFLVGTFLLAFVVLPAMLSAVAPIGYRAILKELQSAIVLALVTTLSVVALPLVQQAAERVATIAGCPASEERDDVIKATLSLSYVLAQLGNYFIYLLVLYGAYAYRIELTTPEQLLLPVWTLLSGLGSPTATVNGVVFLGTWLQMPPDLLTLYLETSTVTRYGQVGLSVIGFGFATILVPLVYFGKARLRPMRGLVGAFTSIVLLGVVVLGASLLRPLLLSPEGDAFLHQTVDPRLLHAVEVTLHRPDAGRVAAPADARDRSAQGIQQSGVLRVGYNPHAPPFSYWNDDGNLVGYDIAMAYELAHDLHVRLELIPFRPQALPNDLVERRFDLAVGGIYETDDRLQTLAVSQPYFHSPVALIVPADRARRFLSHAAIAVLPHLRLAVIDDPILLSLARVLFPKAQIEVMRNYDDLPEMANRIDGAIWTLQEASSWAKVHSGFTAVAPTDMGGPIPLAYLMPPGANAFQYYLDQWLQLKIADGFTAAAVDYWIKGQSRPERRPRWSLLDMLLGQARQPVLRE